jgi:DNA repair photolyase
VRWDHLEKGRERQPSLPGMNEPVVRSFDAPEALGIRFHEVHAKSAINAVPNASRMPFRWTVNVYRGCTHACSYCMSGSTPVLMADGRCKPLDELRVGDRIYGTRAGETYRRYVETTVLDHWSTTKSAFRIGLEDGSELIASGDHRFLTRRGWKYVEGRQAGELRRPYLTLRSDLMGFGALGPPPKTDEEYQRGYLCGLLRGDAHLGTYAYASRGRTYECHRFRLALADTEALNRGQDYLLAFGVETDRFEFCPARGERRAMTAIRTAARDRVARIHEVIAWPTRPSISWYAGFLSGIFDAEGSCSLGVLRIANSDPRILGMTSDALRALGLTAVLEQPRPNGVRSVRVLGGLVARQRFFQQTDPAITRKRSIAGAALKTKANLRVTEIEPLLESRELYDITTGTGDFIANGVVSHNCFARPTHTYLDLNAREDFEREIVVKVNAPERVRAELARPSWRGELVALGTNTDPYQWVESRYELTRGVWEAMRDFRNPCSVLTKSPLLLRDLDLFRELVERTEFSANLSVPTLDEKVWRQTEPHTPHPRKRLEAVAELTRNGIPSSVLVAPLMPGINDSPSQVERILELAGEAGARSVTPIGLHLRGEVRDIFFDWLHQYRPDLIERYERLYSRGAYLPTAERKRLAQVGRARHGAP